MAMSRTDWEITTWCTVLPVLLAFTFYGFKVGTQMSTTDNSLKFYTTARKKFGMVQLIPAFVFAFLGSKLLTNPGEYAATTGVLGLCMLAIFSGFAVVIVALIGRWVKSAVEGEGVEALSDFVNARFGSLAELYVACLVLFNTAVLLLAEYDTIRYIFMEYVGTKGYIIVLAVGVSALIYTNFGGLFATMKVHPFQAALIGVLCIIMASYVGARFDRELPKKLTKAQQGYTPEGYSAIIVQPIVLISTAFFNEALWQKCWASANDKDLTTGAGIAGFLVVGLTLASGFMSLSAQWTGLIPRGDKAPLNFFHIFDQVRRPVRLRRWIGVVASLTGATFSQAHASALQMGITCSVCSFMLRGQQQIQGRFTSFVFNVPLIAVACATLDDLPKLYRLASMICATSLFPVAAGAQMSLLDLYTGDMMLFSVALGVVGTSFFGVYRVWDPRDKAGSFNLGMEQAWWTTGYQWKYFLIALLSSVCGVVLCIVLGMLLAAVKVPFIGNLSPTKLYDTGFAKLSQLWAQPANKAPKKTEK